MAPCAGEWYWSHVLSSADGRWAPGPLLKPRPERAQAHAHLACLEQRRERALEAREAHRHYGTALNQKSAGVAPCAGEWYWPHVLSSADGRWAPGPLLKPQAERAQAHAHLACLEQRRERALEAREAHRHYGTALNQKSAGVAPCAGEWYWSHVLSSADGRWAPGPLLKPRPERAQAHAHLACLEQRRERALEAREAHRHYGTALNQKSAGVAPCAGEWYWSHVLSSADGRWAPGPLLKPRPERAQAHAHLACLEQRRERALEAREAHRHYGTALNQKSAGVAPCAGEWYWSHVLSSADGRWAPGPLLKPQAERAQAHAHLACLEQRRERALEAREAHRHYGTALNQKSAGVAPCAGEWYWSHVLSSADGRWAPGPLLKPRPERAQAHAHLACLEQRRERALEAREAHRHYGTALNQKSAGVAPCAGEWYWSHVLSSADGRWAPGPLLKPQAERAQAHAHLACLEQRRERALEAREAHRHYGTALNQKSAGVAPCAGEWYWSHVLSSADGRWAPGPLLKPQARASASARPSRVP